MRLVRNIVLFIITLYIAIVVFMPTSQLYYFAEQQLEDKGIIIGDEKIVDKIVSFELLNPIVYYQAVDIIKATKIKVTPLLFVNSLRAENIELLNIAKKFLNIHIDSLDAKHSIFNPYRIKIDATGNFGVAHGYADLKNRILYLKLTDIKNINSIKRYLKKSEKGWYYETKF